MGGKVGPDLTLVGEKRTDPAWHAKHFKDPERVSPGSTMPSYRSLIAGDVQALTVFLLSLREMPTSLAAAVPLSPEAAPTLFPPLPRLRGHWEAPGEENRRPNPLPATPDSIATGKRLYARYCATCHGKEGEGEGPGAANQEPRPAAFADARMMAHERDGGLFWKIGEGRRLMPPWKDTLGESDRWNLVNFLRTLPKGPMPGMRDMPGHGDEPGDEPHGHMEGEEPGHGHMEAGEPAHGHGAPGKARRPTPRRPHRDRPGAPPHGH
jgi:mono/diheme cytochrome c family protein